MLQWQGFDFTSINMWEDEILEFDGLQLNSSFPPQDWADRTIELTETVTNDVTFLLLANKFEYSGTFDNDASAEDYDGNFIGEFTISAGDRLFPITQLIYPIIDVINEGPEGIGLRIAPLPSSGVEANDNFDVFDIRIIEVMTNTEDLELLNSSINSYSFIANETLNIECLNPEIKIESIKVYDFSGKLIWRQEYNTYSKVQVNFDPTTTPGYKLIIIETNHGDVTKKFFKK